MATYRGDQPSERDATIVAHFVALIHSHAVHDHRQAADALERLAELGVIVRFQDSRRSKAGPPGSRAANPKRQERLPGGKSNAGR